jgi:hypothetical protein
MCGVFSHQAVLDVCDHTYHIGIPGACGLVEKEALVAGYGAGRRYLGINRRGISDVGISFVRTDGTICRQESLRRHSI